MSRLLPALHYLSLGEKLAQLDLVIPGLCGPLPEVESLDSESIKSLVSCLSKSNRVLDYYPTSKNNFYDVLVTIFGLTADQSLPVAALSLLASDHDISQGHWFCADPVQLQADMDHAILRDAQSLGLTQDESDAFLAELNAHFHEDGISFVATDKEHWFVNVPDQQQISTTALNDVIARNINFFMPQGEDALFWKKLMNEVQMLLHLSPVNEKREQQNKLPVNGLWFWGEGELPCKTDSEITEVYSSNPVVKGLADLSNIKYHSDFDIENIKSESNTLMVLDDLFGITGYGDVGEWQKVFSELYLNKMKPIIELAMKKKIKINLHPCNGVCYQLSAKNKFRFFRDKRIASYIDSYE